MHPDRLISTYSIVARDPETGDLGVAVQSHYFSVGPICPWAEAGIGAVATQSFVDPSYGPLGLELMRAGRDAEETLRGLVEADEGRARRQVAMVDSTGKAAAHTGELCIPHAGHVIGAGYSCQANMMTNATVWDAMAKAFEQTDGELSSRMLAALEAAESEGGDIRGRQSAAMLVVDGMSTGKVWLDKKLELRVEDHPEPLEELRRLVDIHRAYRMATEAEKKMSEGQDVEQAAAEFELALALSGDNIELRYWHALTLAMSGDLDKASPLLRDVYSVDPRWKELTSRLPSAGIIPNDTELIARLASI